MSAANASAIRRRAGNNPSTSATPTTNNDLQANQPQQKGLTIQQVISNFDRRIKELELKPINQNNISTEDSTVFSREIIEEYNSRFEIIANEIADLKNAMLKLQTFTMEVNKSLHDDRIRVLSDIDTTDTNIKFEVENTEPILENDKLENNNIKETENSQQTNLENIESVIEPENHE
tara:strand:+ start:1465 stop:1995 length:531 start_codon:yes stop_codon:yes gene_type:complete